MASPLDFVLEVHDGPEPRVLTSDVQAILRRVIRPGKEDGGESVALIAEKARVSTRTVYRVLTPPSDKQDISLSLADKLCRAADAHVRVCHLVWPDGTVTDYSYIPVA